MAVYKRTYKSYSGELSPEWSRFLILTRYSFGALFRSRLLAGFFIVCFFPFLLCLSGLYLNHNLALLRMLRFNGPSFMTVDATFFDRFLSIQLGFAMFLTAFTGPSLIAPDLTGNGLALYFCRPFSRVEYVLGKLAVLLTLLSAITWVPALLLYGVQSSLEGAAWAWANGWIARSTFLAGLLAILVFSFLALALSAWVRWKPVAGGLVLAVLFLGAGFSEVIHAILRTDKGAVLNITGLIQIVWASLFGVAPPRHSISVPGACVALLAISGLLLYLLSRKLRAFEVVR